MSRAWSLKGGSLIDRRRAKGPLYLQPGGGGGGGGGLRCFSVLFYSTNRATELDTGNCQDRGLLPITPTNGVFPGAQGLCLEVPGH